MPKTKSPGTTVKPDNMNGNLDLKSALLSVENAINLMHTFSVAITRYFKKLDDQMLAEFVSALAGKSEHKKAEDNFTKIKSAVIDVFDDLKDEERGYIYNAGINHRSSKGIFIKEQKIDMLGRLSAYKQVFCTQSKQTFVLLSATAERILEMAKSTEHPVYPICIRRSLERIVSFASILTNISEHQLLAFNKVIREINNLETEEDLCCFEILREKKFSESESIELMLVPLLNVLDIINLIESNLELPDNQNFIRYKYPDFLKIIRRKMYTFADDFIAEANTQLSNIFLISHVESIDEIGIINTQKLELITNDFIEKVNTESAVLGIKFKAIKVAKVNNETPSISNVQQFIYALYYGVVMGDNSLSLDILDFNLEIGDDIKQQSMATTDLYAISLNEDNIIRQDDQASLPAQYSEKEPPKKFLVDSQVTGSAKGGQKSKNSFCSIS